MVPKSDASFLRPYSSLQLALKASHKQSPVIQAWLHWWHEISSTPYSVSEPSVAETKLAWWAKAVTLSFETPPQHPLLKAVAPGKGVIQAPPIDLWLSQIRAMLQLSAQTRWLDEATLTQHIDASTGAACESVAWLMGVRAPEVLQIAREMGQGLRRAHILSRLGQDTQKGWLHFPIDFLQQHNVKAHELLKPTDSGVSAQVIALLDTWQNQTRQQLIDSIAAVKKLSRKEKQQLKPLLLLCKLNLQLMDDLKTQGYPVFKQRLMVGPLRKLWISRKVAWFAL